MALCKSHLDLKKIVYKDILNINKCTMQYKKQTNKQIKKIRKKNKYVTKTPLHQLQLLVQKKHKITCMRKKNRSHARC